MQRTKPRNKTVADSSGTAVTPRKMVGMIKMLDLDKQVRIMIGNPEAPEGTYFLMPIDSPVAGASEEELKTFLDHRRDILILNTDENREKALSFKYEYALTSSKNLFDFFMHMNKPYRLLMLELASGVFGAAGFNGEYETILRDAWMSTELPHQSKVDRLVSLFERADPDLLMTDAEKAKLAEMPDTFTVYRGYSETQVRAKRTKRRGLSWSLDKKIAIWFAKRWSHPDARLLQATVNKSELYMYSNERREQEVVVNPRKVRGVKLNAL